MGFIARVTWLVKGWDPARHPRGPDGRFITIGSLVHDIARTVTHPGGHHGDSQRRPGRDLRHEFSEADAGKLIEARWGDRSGLHPAVAASRNPALTEIARRQGWGDTPRVVSKDEMDQLVAAGHRELFRGVAPQRRGDDGPIVRTAADMLEQARSGHDWHGRGVYGDGVYVTPSRVSARYYARKKDTGVARMALAPDARVIGIDDLLKQMNDELGVGTYTVHDAVGRNPRTGRVVAGYNPNAPSGVSWPFPAHQISYMDDLQRDPGVFAAMRGYDAIHIPYDDGFGVRDQYNVLNRSVLIHEAAPPKPARRRKVATP